jgi:hypothetical protein
LLVLQIGGCAFDVTHRQLSLLPAFCMVTPNAWLEAIVIAIGFLLTFSWVAGVLGLRFAPLRPVYWLLLVAIPLAYAGQIWLLQRGVLACDAP